jgi:xylan 1,4-beta-xylosidase
MNMIQNPILPGFHPDPSICRVGKDYYIATSTFEWWPGVRIHHSQDLVNWSHCAYALTNKDQLDLSGHPDSTGIWAPCLSYADNQFWLIYTDVRSLAGAYKDTHNYLITAPSIHGPWSEPIYLNSSGFDPSLFHDDDGRRWLLNQQWIHHPKHQPFNGILLQEYDSKNRKLIGSVKNIFATTALGCVEGPHLYKRNGYYYLLTAEGGTSYEHAVTFARSKSMDGPYELMPSNPLLTAHHKDPKALQRAGHASLVETQHGEWYLAHLCGRPLEWAGPNAGKADNTHGYGHLHCVLGRETALQQVQWREDGWLELVGGGNVPRHEVAAPKGLAIQDKPLTLARDDFDAAELNHDFNSLRIPVDATWMSLTERPGFLRLKGRESLMSLFEQSLVARRQQHFNCRVETLLDFTPDNFQQMAGLVAYYSTANHSYLHVTADPISGQRLLHLYVNRDGALSEPNPSIQITPGSVKLKLEFTHDQYQYFYALANDDWQAFGAPLPAAMLSDESATRSRDGYFYSFGFTGNYIGVACQDLGGTRKAADFDYFVYEPL